MKKILFFVCTTILFMIGCSKEKFESIYISGSAGILNNDGSVSFGEGTSITLSGDFNNNGIIEDGENFKEDTDEYGRYKIKGEFPQRFRGNLLVSMKRKGFISFIRTLPAKKGEYSINGILLPSEVATCKGGVCTVASNTITIENLPENVSGGQMRVFSPVSQSMYFPGNFEDIEGKMLISTAFSEIELYDNDGNKITDAQNGDGFKVKMKIPADSLGSLKDLKPETEDVEVPMFYFDEVKGAWIESGEGWLEYENSTRVKNTELADVITGKYKGNVYTVFYAPHLSWWNVDWKNENVTCLMGRILIDSIIPSGVEIVASGINYNIDLPSCNWFFWNCQNSGIRTRVFTDENGWFVVSVYKSENSDEDVDGDGITGEVHRATITATYNGITWNLGEFITPNRYSPWREGNIYCVPPDCGGCQNLGDFNLSSTQTTPPCELYGIVKYSGVENVSGGSGNTPQQGSPVAGVTVSIFDTDMSPEIRSEICTRNGIDVCAPQTSDNEGRIHIFYAVDASAMISTGLTLSQGDITEGFTGSGIINGCPQSSPENPYPIFVDYFYKRTGNYPDSPGNVNAGGECGELTTITWIDRSDNESGFKIIRKQENEDYKLLADLARDINSHPDSTTARNTYYCYQVVAYRILEGVEYSSPSKEFCMTTSSKFCPPPPNSPSNLSGNGASGFVTLTWKEVNRETGYKIARREITGGSCSEGGGGEDINTVYNKGYIEIGVAGVDAVSFVDTRVTGKTCYCYRVFGFNDAGNSGSSNPYCLVVPECIDGYTRNCYSGTPGTDGVGVCHGGFQICSGGFWPDTCTGEVTPQDEVCDGYDNDCDQEVDETCSCTDGTSQPCYTGPPGTEGVGICHAGIQVCSGNSWGACSGDVVPSSEVCGDGLDNDCDGIAEDGCDLTPPDTTITLTPPPMTGNIYATFGFTCNEPSCTFECQIDGTGYSPCASPVTYYNLSGGNHTFHVRAIDSANNIDPIPASYSWFIDTFPPETTIISYPPDPSNSSEATFEFTCSEANCTFECAIDSENYEPCLSPKTYTGLYIGTRTFRVRAIDEFNYVDQTPAIYSWTISADSYTLWIYPTQSYVKSSPVIQDINGDGISDVIIGSDDYKLYAISGNNGALLWNFNTPREISSTPAVGDVDGDGLPEIIAGSNGNNFYALNGEDGTVLWINSVISSGTSSPALADIDGDGKPEIVVGGAELFALNGEDGSILWSVNLSANIQSSPSFGDLDGDGILEIVVGTDMSAIYAINGENGSILWSVNGNNPVISSPAIGNIDGDVLPEVVIGSFDGNVYALNGESGSILWALQTGAPVTSSPALGDFDGDGIPDVAIGSGNGQVFAIKGSNGAVFWVMQTNYDVYSSPALADVNNDGTLDVIIGSADYNLYVLDGRNGNIIFLYPTGNWVSSSPAAGDLDGDGNLEIVFGSWDSKVYAIKTNRAVPPPNLMPWPMFKHDAKNTGVYTGSSSPPW